MAVFALQRQRCILQCCILQFLSVVIYLFYFVSPGMWSPKVMVQISFNTTLNAILRFFTTRLSLQVVLLYCGFLVETQDRLYMLSTRDCHVLWEKEKKNVPRGKGKGQGLDIICLLLDSVWCNSAADLQICVIMQLHCCWSHSCQSLFIIQTRLF